MFDFSWSEVAVIVIIALIFIGPKDLPIAIKSVSRAFKAMRKMAGEFQTHVDDFVKEADLGEARDHLRDLTPAKLRHRLFDSIDSDRAIRDGMHIAPPPPSLSSPVFRPPETQPEPAEVSVASTIPQMSARVEADLGCGLQKPPACLPPNVARRILRDRSLHASPRFVPPMRIIHGGRRVRLGVTLVGTAITGSKARADD